MIHKRIILSKYRKRRKPHFKLENKCNRYNIKYIPFTLNISSLIENDFHIFLFFLTFLTNSEKEIKKEGNDK